MIDVGHDFVGVPFKARNEGRKSSRKTRLEFKHVPIQMGADEPDGGRAYYAI